MGAIITYFRTPSGCRKSQASGLSPSPTEDTGGQKGLGLEQTAPDDVKRSTSAIEQTDQKHSEEPESNDTSYGVEATAVRTLAASTGTVAILGTTAKVLEASEAADTVSAEVTNNERFKDNPSISVTEVESEENESTPDEEKQNEEISGKPDNEPELQESADANNVLQQKEIKEIENEALQERQSDITSSQETPEPSIPTEEVQEEKERLPELTQETQSENVPSSEADTLLAVEDPISQSKEETQLPKIVDYQEKKNITSINPEQSDDDGPTVTIPAAEQESDPEKLKETLVETETSPEEIRLPQDNDGVSPDVSKTEEDNDISSEQLKTNSLSDMSISEALNSEGEEAAREAAKAQELQEMVESLSASAKEAAIDYDVGPSEASFSNGSSMRISARKSSELEPSIHETIIEEKLSPETNDEDAYLSEPETKNEVKVQAQGSTSHTSETVADSSKQTEENKVSEKEDAIVNHPEKPLELPKKNENENEIIDDSKEAAITEMTTKETEEQVEGNIESKEVSETKEDEKLAAAATTIQSNFRGYKVRKDLKDVSELSPNNEDTKNNEIDETSSDNTKDSKVLDSVSTSEQEAESNQKESKGKEEIAQEESSSDLGITNAPDTVAANDPDSVVSSAPDSVVTNEPESTSTPDTGLANDSDSLVANAPESLVKIAKAEVDKICQEAEKTTESLITPPFRDDGDALNTDYQDENEEFPAPPDDLLDNNDKNDTIKEDQDSSGTEPTIPLGTNTDGDSSRTEDTTATSFAESEVKSNDPLQPLKTDENKPESSITEDNMNTEVTVNRDSTEGELTMEEDSKDEDIGSVLQIAKEQDGSKTEKSDGEDQANNEKAATVIQAGYRGFKTRKDLKNKTPVELETEKDKPNPLPNEGNINGTVSSLHNSEVKIPQVTDEKPKRPTQIDVPKIEDIGSIQDESNLADSPAQDSQSESKDDTSSTTLSEEELNEKASKIQAGVRGYLVRKEQKAKRDAAVKIQSTFRGFKTRQRLKQD